MKCNSINYIQNKIKIYKIIKENFGNIYFLLNNYLVNKYTKDSKKGYVKYHKTQK